MPQGPGTELHLIFNSITINKLLTARGPSLNVLFGDDSKLLTRGVESSNKERKNAVKSRFAAKKVKLKIFYLVLKI